MRTNKHVPGIEHPASNTVTSLNPPSEKKSTNVLTEFATKLFQEKIGTGNSNGRSTTGRSKINTEIVSGGAERRKGFRFPKA